MKDQFEDSGDVLGLQLTRGIINTVLAGVKVAFTNEFPPLMKAYTPFWVTSPPIPHSVKTVSQDSGNVRAVLDFKVLHFVAVNHGDVAMTQNSWIANNDAARIFKASKIWEFNVWGAIVGGIGGGLVMLVVATILIFDSVGPTGRMYGLALFLTIIVTLLAMFPGNLIAATPVAVELESGRALRIIAPLKKLCIPIEDVQSVQDSTSAWIYRHGAVVKLNKRHGLLKSFAIHWAFGNEGQQLAQAIRRELLLRG